jgi:lipopolysaccharide export system protein LptC
VHFDPQTAPVKIDANEALVSRDGDHVHFKGEVHIVRDAYADQQEMSLETDYLHLIPDENLATTDKPVTLRQGDTVVKSVGMRYDHGARILQLQSQVKVTYASSLNLSSLRRK